MIFSKKRKEKRSSNNNSSEANQNSSCLVLALCDQQERESRANKPGSAHTTISSQATWVEIGVSECVRRTYIHTYIWLWVYANNIDCSLALCAVFDFAYGRRWLTFERFIHTRTDTHTHTQWTNLSTWRGQETHFQLNSEQTLQQSFAHMHKHVKAAAITKTATINTNSRNKNNSAYMPTLTQLKYIPYYLTKEIVLFASSTQRAAAITCVSANMNQTFWK